MTDEAPVTVHMRLLAGGEGWRPVQAIRQREDVYCVVGPVGEGETWQFPPGSMVRRKPLTLSDGTKVMAAVAAAG